MERSAISSNMGNVFLSDALEEVLQRIGLGIPPGCLVESDLNDLPPVFGSKQLIMEIFNKILNSHLNLFIENSDLGESEAIKKENYRIKITAESEGSSTRVKFSDNLSLTGDEETESADCHFLRNGMMQMDGFFDAGFNHGESEDCGTVCQLYFLNNPHEN